MTPSLNRLQDFDNRVAECKKKTRFVWDTGNEHDKFGVKVLK